MPENRVRINRATMTVFLLALALIALSALGCSSLPQLVQKGRDAKTIKPSGVIISETREVSGFTALDIRTVGKVVLTQGDSESLAISGSDNLVPLVVTRVSNGTLIIETKENIALTGLHSDNVPTFEIALKDLSKLTLSGLATVEMEALATSGLEVTVSGAGGFKLDDLSANSVDIALSGFGNVEIAGQVTGQAIAISGAGQVDNAGLECKTAEVDVPGLGTATIWVTDKLTGEISGGGSVRYYGSPETDTETTGLGRFEALGAK